MGNPAHPESPAVSRATCRAAAVFTLLDHACVFRGAHGQCSTALPSERKMVYSLSN